MMAQDTPRQADFKPSYMPHVLIMVGVSGSGKSSWAKTHAAGLHVLSSDQMRAMLTDQEDHQGITREAFELLKQMAQLRLKHGRPVIIDATNTQAASRVGWLELAREHGVPAFVLWFDVDAQTCIARQQQRERYVPSFVIERQLQELGQAEQELMSEGWDQIVRYTPGESLDQPGGYTWLRRYEAPLISRQDEHSARLNATAFDVIGDVHGCLDELEALMLKLGWLRDETRASGWRHPEDRPIVFVGDLVDRGPSSVGVVSLVAKLVAQEQALLILGNHDDKVRRLISDHKIKTDGHIQTTIDELEALDEDALAAFKALARTLFEGAPYWAFAAPTDGPGPMGLGAEVVIAHAAWKPSLIGQKRDKVRWFCLYGPSTGKTDERGYPERLDWKARYPRKAPLCITGHTAYYGEVAERNNTICVDTACVFGQRLTALRYPERAVVSVDAARVYSEHEGLEEQPKLVSDRG